MKKSKLLVVSGVALASLFTVVGCGGSGETAEEKVNRVASEVKVGYAAFKDGIKTNQQLQALVDGVTVTYTETSDRLTVSADGKTLEVTVPYLGDKITVEGTEVTVDDSWYETAVIVATFSYKGVEVTQNIPVMLVAAANVMSFDQYIAAAANTAACVQIVVDRVGMERKYNYVLVWGHDAQGNGYYIYNAGDKNLGKLEPGNEVILSGTKDIYSGYHELKKVDSCTLVSEGNAVISTPKDITSTLVAAENMASNDLVKLQGSLVKASGLIITDVRKEGEWVEGKDGAESYGEKFFVDVVAVEGGPEFTIGICRSADDFVDLWAALETLKVDDVITVEGYASWFDVFNITLVGNDITVTGTVQKTNQEKINDSKAKIEEDLTKNAYTNMTLPIVGSYDDVKVAWTSSDPNIISIAADGKCTINGADEEKTVTLTAVISIEGEPETATITHTITVPKLTASNILNARNYYPGSGDQAGITVEGQVTAIQGSSFYIDDGFSSMFIYNYSNHGFAVGDSVTITGTLASYNGLMQIKSKTAGGKLTDKTYTARSVVTLTETEFTKENLAGEDGRIVKLEGLVYQSTKEGPWVSKGTTAQYIFKLGNTEVTLTLNKYANNGADVAAIIEALEAGDVIDVTAPMGWYKGPQIDLTDASEITVK